LLSGQPCYFPDQIKFEFEYIIDHSNIEKHNYIGLEKLLEKKKYFFPPKIKENSI